MEECKYLLIGGGLAAVKAAEMLRKLDAGGSIFMVSEERNLPYDRPPLSKEYLRGEKKPVDIIYQPESFYSQNRIGVSLGVAATKLKPEDHVVMLSDGREIGYEKLLLATGGRPRVLTVPGASLGGIYYLRTMDDSDAIREEAMPGRKTVIVGGGFIGLEAAASLSKMGVQVTVLEAMPYIWSRFLDETLASFFQAYCEDKGIRFITAEAVAEFRGGKSVEEVVTSGGKGLDCDFACVGVGIIPNMELAQGCGLRIDNGIVIDEHLRTSAPDIYAAGDVINFYDPIFERRRRVEHWGHAEYTGLLAAQNMSGTTATYNLLSYVWSDIFDLHIEFAGDEAEHDQMLLRGRPGDGPFIALYLKGNVLRAYLAINTDDRSFPPLQRLIRNRADLSERLEALQDPSADLRELVRR